MPDLLNEALKYAKKGWYVFPVREKIGTPYTKNGEVFTPREKTPYITGGLNSASIDEEQIRAWWNRFPYAMIGVNCGKSGLFVVDIDKKNVNGLDTFMEWHINDTGALHSFTPSGGMHIVFTGEGKSSTNAKTGIDTRGEGGYFIAPPSEVLEGDYIGSYVAYDDWSRIPAVIPPNLMGRLFPERSREYSYTEDKYMIDGKKQLSKATLYFMVNGAPKGERNPTLFKVLADFAGCGYTEDEAKEIVSPVSDRIGLSRDEFLKVLEHAFSKPRTASIPDSIQMKLLRGGRNIASEITYEEQSIMEDALLSCLIKNNELIPVIFDILNPDDFQVLKNRVIYKNIVRLNQKDVRVDLITITNELEKTTDKIKLDEISKMLDDHNITSDSVIAYANIIKEKSSIRKIEQLMDNKQNYIKSGNLVDIISSVEKDLANIAVYGGVRTTNILTGEQATKLVEDRTRAILNGDITQLKTGFIDYDKHIGGIYSNELVICAGRAGDGKSALSLTIINEVGLNQKLPVAMFSLEMSTHETICRLICQLTGIPFRNVYQGRLTDNQWVQYKEAMEYIKDSKIFFDDSADITIPELRSKIRKLAEKDVKLIVIDQLEQIKGYEGQPAYIQFDKIAYDIKSFTKEFDIPIILNHQLNRGITDRRIKKDNPEPELSDLNQAGEKPANQVWAISHKKDEEGKILASKVRVLKNRNGPRIDFNVKFLGEKMLFVNAAFEDWNKYDDMQQAEIEEDFEIHDAPSMFR